VRPGHAGHRPAFFSPRCSRTKRSFPSGTEGWRRSGCAKAVPKVLGASVTNGRLTRFTRGPRAENQRRLRNPDGLPHFATPACFRGAGSRGRGVRAAGEGREDGAILALAKLSGIHPTRDVQTRKCLLPTGKGKSVGPLPRYPAGNSKRTAPTHRPFPLLRRVIGMGRGRPQNFEGAHGGWVHR
jgi:hypothetical protein